MTNENFIQCSKCVMDNLAPNTNLVLDNEGICNNCNTYSDYVSRNILKLTTEQRLEKLTNTVDKIKNAGKGKEYDCILGISGGMDSAYLAYRAHQLGLRPLVVHFDNGWNSELAVKNISNVLTKLNFELNTYVINWEEFKDLHLAYFKASVVDIEVPTDHFIYASLYEIAYKKGIKYILDGNNIETEFSRVSWKWSYNKLDLVNLQNIHKKFGNKRLKKYPKLGIFQRYFFSSIVGIESCYLLNYEPYKREEVITLLTKEFGWKDPGGKHYESIFTRFYQGYILPKKFNVDKRKAHLSNLIWSNQMSREDALKTMETPAYDEELQLHDKDYIIKKFEITPTEFDCIMNTKIIPHEFYGTDKSHEFKFKLFVKFVESFPGRAFLYLLKRLKIIKSLY